ncbi:MAG: 30S ribosomal protein S12 methylthiotransferase RimO, partial [Bacteroidales bacterium]|nr:30S ribosomal protein S12 methylthiotransferase RimO [Bacteroidales bacterium]
INVVTLGCSKNLVDSENLMGALRKGGLNVVHDAPGEGFAGVVINTCGFILDAKDESIENILNYARARTEGRIGKLVVMGCLAQRYRKELMEEIPELDAVLGVDQLQAVASLFLTSNTTVSWEDRVLTTPGHYAWVKVSEGCDHQCSFCAIPLIRGKHLSRSIDDILAEVAMLKDKGVRETLLIAQDLTWYGMDRYGKRMLPELLRKMLEHGPPDWIRLHYAYPLNFPMEVLDIMQESQNICNYLDIPLQHASDRILASMRRGVTSAQTRKLLDTLRERYPAIKLRTTMITGYPGETEEEFRELLRLVEHYGFERLGAFRYSHEEDTPAYSLEDDIPDELKEERLAELMEVQRGIALEHNHALVGKKLRIIVDSKDEEYSIGRTEWDSPEVDNEVLIPAGHDVRVGEFMDVEITGAAEHELFAIPYKA